MTVIIINLGDNGIYSSFHLHFSSLQHFSFFFLTCNIPILDLDLKCTGRLITLFLNNWLLIDLPPTSVRMMDSQRVSFPKYSHQASQ